ncbi:MAG: hypothetical protein GF364_10725 [Candidatus Lokiarchaeota archaeon]|nr:hypothetical protein [Candidatus Lokiarchaeota archaeon]
MKKIRYKTYPSDDDDWVIIELLDKDLKVDLNKEILTFRYDCVPHPINVDGTLVSCSLFCCYAGCYISPLEIRYVENILDDLKSEYLSEESVQFLNENRDEFYLPEDYDVEEDLYKTRCVPIELPDEYSVSEYNDEDVESFEEDIEDMPVCSCIFLMDNGLCAIHKYCNDRNLNWSLDKFNICTTFPIDIRVTNNATATDAPYPLNKRVEDELSTIKLMESFEEFLYTKMDCVNLSPKRKKKKRIPYIIDSMKYAFVSRFGEDMWYAIKDYARKYRKKNKE